MLVRNKEKLYFILCLPTNRSVMQNIGTKILQYVKLSHWKSMEKQEKEAIRIR